MTSTFECSKNGGITITDGWFVADKDKRGAQWAPRLSFTILTG